MLKGCLFSLLILVLCTSVHFSQSRFSNSSAFQSAHFTQASDSLKKRKIILLSSSTFITVSTLAGLHQVWYKQYNTGKFHFFDDRKEWLQMDKVGHIYSNYVISEMMMKAFDWAGYSKNKKLLIGGGLGFAYMTVVELMDGYSRGWGFSVPDQICNILGSSAAIAQEGLWGRQEFRLKFSYAESGLAGYRPGTLGDSPSTRLLKDYNGQTYWLSFNPFAFGKREVKWFPPWASVSLGYSAYGMLGGTYNSVLPLNENGDALYFERERRFYLSLDVDLSKIKTKQKWLKNIFTALNILKLPAPALQLSGGKIRAYALYY